MIFVLCGAAGLRIGEVLGIEIDKHTAPDFLPSTSNKRFVTARWSNGSRLPTGFVRLIYTQRLPGFSNSSLATGKLVSSSVLERGDPSHPRTSSGVICIKALKELKYVNPFTGTHKLETMHSVIFGTRTCGTTRSVRRAYTNTGWVMRGRT
jgi:hypothetical protein